MAAADTREAGESRLRVTFPDAGAANRFPEHECVTYRLLAYADASNRVVPPTDRHSATCTRKRRVFARCAGLSGDSFALGVMEPELSTPCGKGRKGGGKNQMEEWTSAEQDFALCRTGGLTPIMLVVKVHDTAHAHSTGNIHQESRDQAGAPRAGVGLQPPTSAANSDGADGADTALHRGHCCRLPPPLARAGARGRSLRSRGRRAVARRIAGEG